MRKGERTRAELIDGTARALVDVGVLGITTRKIAEECGVSLATLHYHFESKAELLYAVFEQIIEEMTDALRDEIKESSTLDECIENLFRGAWRWTMQTRQQQVVQYELTLFALREGFQSLAERQYDAYIRFFLEFLLDTTKKTGELPPADCKVLAHMMLASMDGLILQELAHPNRMRSKRSLDALIESTKRYAASVRGNRATRNAAEKEQPQRADGAEKS